MALLVQAGIGTVRTRFPLPTRSTSTQRASRCWICSTASSASSSRRNPQPINRQSSARSRFPLLVARSGSASICSACPCVSQFPVRVPWRLAPLTRPMAAASSGANNWLSADSAASFRSALSRTLMVEGVVFVIICRRYFGNICRSNCAALIADRMRRTAE